MPDRQDHEPIFTFDAESDVDRLEAAEEEARCRLAGPRKGLLVLASIWWALIWWALMFNVWLLYSGAAQRLPQPRVGSKQSQIIFRASWSVVMLIVNSRILVGARRMKHLRKHRQAVWACYLSLIPCLGPFYILGIPFGIWGLTVLNDPRVEAAFQS